MMIELLACAPSLALTSTFGAARTPAVCLTSSFTRVSSRAAAWLTTTVGRIGLIDRPLENIFRVIQQFHVLVVLIHCGLISYRRFYAFGN